MSLRMIGVTIHPGDQEPVRQALLDEYQPHALWSQTIPDDRVLLWIVVDEGQTEALLDRLESRFGAREGFRAVVLPVEAALPRPEEPATPSGARHLSGTAPANHTGRISREELYDDIAGAAHLTPVFIAMTLLSAVVAMFGLLNNNAAVILGAMVIAPLLGPNLALSLATTLGDLDLARKAVKANLVGTGLPFLLAAISGTVLPVNPQVDEIALRTFLEPSALVVALASGAAGALAYTTGVATALIGVMVAVALLPPLVVCGLLIGAGYWDPAFGAFQLFASNLICVNLAGVLTFLAQGVRPRRWWEVQRAQRATRIALSLWSLSFVLLIVILWFGRR